MSELLHPIMHQYHDTVNPSEELREDYEFYVLEKFLDLPREKQVAYAVKDINQPGGINGAMACRFAGFFSFEHDLWNEAQG